MTISVILMKKEIGKQKPSLTNSAGFIIFAKTLQAMLIKKGRNEKLIEKRNRKLVCRFYFYSNLMSLNFSKCLELLEEELDLSQSRITDLLAANSDLITLLERSNTTLADLKTAYPFMSWHYDHGKRSQNAGQMSLALFA